MKVKVDELAQAVARELEAYSEAVTNGLKADVKAVAKECVADIRQRSPKKTGRYAKGWRAKTAYESGDDIRVSICNATDAALTHLLENGHATAKGGRVPGKPHIRPAEAAAIEKLGRRVKVTVGSP